MSACGGLDSYSGWARSRSLRSGIPGCPIELGWIEGRNLQLDIRFGNADAGSIWALSSELVGFAPDVIVPNSLPATIAVQQLTRTIPIVFVAVGDPIVTGLVNNIARRLRQRGHSTRLR
jgi:putative tryptophan/tyrosine transport system substrate-binding protein